MSDHFSGFSQEEIKKVSYPKAKKSETTKEAFQGHHHVGIRRAATTGPARQIKKLNNNNIKKTNTNNEVAAEKNGVAESAAKLKSQDDNDDSLDEEQLNRGLSQSMEDALFNRPPKNGYSNDTKAKAATVATTIAAAADDSSLLKLPNKLESETSTSSDTNSLTDSSILHLKPTTEHSEVKPIDLNVDSPFKGISLQDFESHRKLVEEQNRQKKVLLQKAIEHHSQKTAAEARKIEEIRGELAKLDNDLAVDVAILRKQIDNACINFSSIEKNYVKVEAQFLKVKMDLHNAAEKKELLTEHLCTVIAHNEDRKAQKLSELMQKVGLTPTGEYDEAYTNGTSDK